MSFNLRSLNDSLPFVSLPSGSESSESLSLLSLDKAINEIIEDEVVSASSQEFPFVCQRSKIHKYYCDNKEEVISKLTKKYKRMDTYERAHEFLKSANSRLKVEALLRAGVHPDVRDLDLRTVLHSSSDPEIKELIFMYTMTMLYVGHLKMVN